MQRNVFLLVLLTLALTSFSPVFAQERPQQDDDDVVKISTNLVQIDAVVTDKNGNPVTNLTAADFEIRQDGKPQKITNLTYVNTEQKALAKSGKIDKNAPLAPTVNVRPENAGRLLTFVVDDGNCFASRLGMFSVREALEKFVKEQMQPNDLVAIYQTRGGSSVLQRFSSDKTQLMNVIRKIRWYPPVRCSNEATGGNFDPLRGPEAAPNRQDMGTDRDYSQLSRDKVSENSKDHQLVGLIGVLNYVTRGLEKVAGRKTVFLLSDGLSLFTSEGKIGNKILDMREFIDTANRASVVFNTIDVRGSLNLGEIDSADDSNSMKGGSLEDDKIDKERKRRIKEVGITQSGLAYLANETGGRFYQGANNFDVPIRRALNLEKGYYLIGYEPDENTFKSKNFNKIDINVKRDDLNVRSRSGFFGRTDESLRPKRRNADSELYEALVAPLPNAGLNLRLSAYFANSPEQGNVVRSFIHLDGQGINFVDDSNNMKKAVFDVVAVTLDEKSKVVEEFNKTHTIRIPANEVALIQQKGLIYSTDVPLKKSGAYTFRVAIRDASSKQIGSASQLIEVPDLAKNKFFMSGLNLGAVALKDGKPLPLTQTKVENGFTPVSSASNPAIRRFGRGAILVYNYTIYNAALDKSSNQPKLITQVRLYRNGEPVLEGQPQPSQIESQADLKRVSDFGYLRLPPDVLTGDYTLQIIIRDSAKNETVAQSIDFEVVQ